MSDDQADMNIAEVVSNQRVFETLFYIEDTLLVWKWRQDPPDTIIVYLREPAP